MVRPSESLTAAGAVALDKLITGRFGIPALILMENAGRDVAFAVLGLNPGRRKIAVICGKGNNGGDGLAAARHLAVSGALVDVYLLSRENDLRGEASVNWFILKSMKICRLFAMVDGPGSGFAAILRKYSVIVDALFGVGLNAVVTGAYAVCIDAINKSRARVISVDIPSGLDSTTGEALGACVKADITVTFLAPKRGMSSPLGAANCGKIIVSDLGAGIRALKKRSRNEKYI